jgi:acetyl-CoA C-acetyltransferase
LATVQSELVARSGIDPAEVGQVVGGCVSQVGEQTFNVARTAWLSAGLPLSVAATTVDAQCGSSQQATNLATAMVAGGVVDVAVACGVEVMSRVPIGSAMRTEFGRPTPTSYFEQYEMTSQFEGAERIADKWGITGPMPTSSGSGPSSWPPGVGRGRFETQIVPSTRPTSTTTASPPAPPIASNATRACATPRSRHSPGLKPVAREDGVHTAGSSSQISDGAAAVLLMTREKADALGLTPRARILDTCNVGVDPVLMLTGPIDATRHLLGRTGLSMSDIDVTEINEAFASVVLAWAKELGPTWTPSTPTVAPSPSAIPSAAPGRS